MNYPELSLMEFAQSIEIGAMCKQPTLGVGPPGIGKTAIAAQVAAKLGLLFMPIEFGMVPDEETAGVFWRNTASGQLERLPIGVIREACMRACFLFCDEITRCTLQRQGCLMTLINERRIGDAVLHPDTVIVLAGNGEESAGTHGLVDALIGRVNICNVVAKRAEVAAHMRTLGAPGSVLRELMIDYAATADRRPELIDETPPKGFSDTKVQYAQPRQIVNGLTRVACMIEKFPTLDITSIVGFSQLAGNIGTDKAAIYLAVRKLRNKLPTVAEIVKDPEHAKVPPDTESGIAALGLIANAAEQSANSAWIYAARLGDPETQAAITRSMLSKVPTDPKGLAAFNSLTGRAARSMKRTA